MVHRSLQVMSSGLTSSTATPGRTCEGHFLDEVGLRVDDECNIVQDPNFGFLQVNQHSPLEPSWDSFIYKLIYKIISISKGVKPLVCGRVSTF